MDLWIYSSRIHTIYSHSNIISLVHLSFLCWIIDPLLGITPISSSSFISNSPFPLATAPSLAAATFPLAAATFPLATATFPLATATFPLATTRVYKWLCDAYNFWDIYMNCKNNLLQFCFTTLHEARYLKLFIITDQIIICHYWFSQRSWYHAASQKTPNKNP